MLKKSVWPAYFPDEPHHMAEFHRTVTACAPAAGVVLDLGCGDNSSFAHLRATGRVVWGVDFQRHPQLTDPEWFRLLPPDGTIPFPTETFDLVTAVWVLEHVEDPMRFLSEVRRVLRPGGVFLGHSINAGHYVTWIRRGLDILPHRCTQWLVERLYGRPSHDTFPTRYRMNTARHLDRAAEAAGLAVVALRRYADPGYFGFSRLALNMAIRTDWLLEHLFPGRGRIYFTVTMQRPNGAVSVPMEAA
jgi:SAM-dependent methyltransferase